MQDGNKALIVGGGTMGFGVAVVLLAGGWRVDVVSPTAATRASLPQRVAQAMQRLDKPFDADALGVPALGRHRAGHRERA